MDFNRVKELAVNFFAKFDHSRRHDRRNDPFILVSLVGTFRGIEIESASYFLTEGETIHNSECPEISLSSALNLVAQMVKSIPDPREYFWTGNEQGYGVATKINNCQYLVVVVIAGFDDARDIAKSLSLMISSAPR